MDVFVWDSDYVTGMEDVDEQHLALIGFFNALNEGLFETPPADERTLQAAARRMQAYALFHFTEEEAMMAAQGVDARHVAQHHALHEQFLEQAQSLWEARASMDNHASMYIAFLTSWLGLHILGVDQSVARQITSIHAGISPQEAFERETAGPSNSTQALLRMISKLYRVLSERNADLTRANQELEERVHQRTLALEQTNTRLLQANAALERFARTDGLLQIANRKCLDERLQQECARAYREQKPLSLVLVDVDHFKQYNDYYGHQAGDRCLQTIVRALAGVVNRSTDLLARYGGEELVVLLPDTAPSGAQVLAEQMRQAVQNLRLAHAHSSAGPLVSVSLGVVSAPPPTRKAGDWLLQMADQALYQAKHQGRNRVVLAPLSGDQNAATT